MSGDFSDFVDVAVDVGSVVATDGAEFLADSSLTEFGFPTDLVETVGYDQAGSFAGNASWFDTFNSGDILSSIPSVGDFSLSSITESLPSLSDIKNFASGVSSDFSGYVRQAQGALQAYQKVAPAVNAASNALGIQNPVNQIIAPVSQAVGIAGAAAGASRSISTTTTTTPLISRSAVSANSDAQFNELDARQTAELEAKVNPAFRNSLIDPSPVNPTDDPNAENVTTYDAATLSKAELTTLKQQYETAIASNEQNIVNANKNIEEMQANLQDPDLSPAQRATLEAQIKANQEAIAQYTDAYASNLNGLSNVNDQLDNDNQIIEQTDSNTTKAPTGVDPTTLEGYGVLGTTPITPNATTITPVDPTTLEGYGLTATGALATTTSITGVVPNTGGVAGATTQALTNQLRNQQAIRSLRGNAAQSTDWRVRLRLAPGATYLYKDGNNALLAPLRNTDGVVFPYTPTIETAYKAIYNPYDLTHSNYRGYFYQGSYVDAVNIRGTFTAQDTNEANYLIAVIQFFRSVTKMFYGQDPEHGAPPPMVYLSGLGDFQFQEHPCVVSQFNYTMPPDVDYIRGGYSVDNGTDFLNNRTRTTIASNPLSYAINRLLNNKLTQGAQDERPQYNGNQPPVDVPTYVPTKMEIAITLLPMQSRQQVSTQFSLQAFSNGNLLKGGFW